MQEISSNTAPIVIVSGMSKADRAIGMKNELLWHVPADLKRFKELTLGHPIIMGLNTFKSILKILGKPLPGRTNIVLNHNLEYKHEGVIVAHSIDEAITIARSENPTEIHVGGGAMIYKQMLPLVSELHITWFFDQKTGDTFFPDFEDEFEITTEHPVQKYEGVEFKWIDYRRK